MFTEKSIFQIKGDWWVIRGLNCGQNDFPGGYDGYPCQHERFILQDNGQWINNVTYCDGKHDQCISDIIVTIANVSLPAPGVVQHDYTDAPLSPQVPEVPIFGILYYYIFVDVILGRKMANCILAESWRLLVYVVVRKIANFELQRRNRFVSAQK